MKECVALYEKVERKLRLFSQASKSVRKATFDKARGHAWFLELHESLLNKSDALSVAQLGQSKIGFASAPVFERHEKLLESELARLDFELPADYRFYLTQISNGGLASEFGIAPLDFSDDFVVHNFREFKEHKVSDFRDDDDDVYLKQFYNARGVVLGQEYHNAHEVFLVCEGHLSGSVWLFDNNLESFKPLHRSFEEHLHLHLSRLDALLGE